MLAVFVNAAAVILGSLVGILLHNRLKPHHTKTVVACMGICAMVIGVTEAIATSNIIIVILCLVAGTVIGELVKLEERLDCTGDWLKARVAKKNGGRFTEGFVTASLLFCVGSMSIVGSFDAGLRGDYDIIFAKSVMDCIMSVTFAATMGIGVAFSALTILIYQGALTLLAGVIEPVLTQPMITEMSAVGGVMLIATGINVVGLTKERIRVGNMLPGLIFPVIWFAIAGLF